MGSIRLHHGEFPPGPPFAPALSPRPAHLPTPFALFPEAEVTEKGLYSEMQSLGRAEMGIPLSTNRGACALNQGDEDRSESQGGGGRWSLLKPVP
jgi:hypothetical protein